MLVEDEFIIRDVARFVLAEAGYKVLEAEHGQAAVDHLDQNPGLFTCLVTDYHMLGEITGAHVILHMRAAYPAIPMILASAFPHVRTPAWRDQHRVELLMKPYDPDHLVQMVTRLLN